MPCKAVVRYTVPMPDDSPILGEAEDMALNGSVLSIVKPGLPPRLEPRTGDVIVTRKVITESSRHRRKAARRVRHKLQVYQRRLYRRVIRDNEICRSRQ